ncbi:MAG TPA: zinc ribbon domain-containing protein [Solirubrobacteraceae bacterium]
MPPIAYFGIESSGLSLVIDLLILFLVVLYVSLLYWTFADARRRIADPMLIGCATAASLFPFVGTIVYMILRPPEYLDDVRERELELQAAEARLHDLDYSLCPHCDYRIERDFVRCPSCLRKLKERCVSCSRPLDRAWTICPYCETDVPAAKPARRGARSERASPSESLGRARAPVDGELEPGPLDVEPVSPARARAAKRAAVRAPEPATIVGETASFASESSSVAADPEAGREEREPDASPKPSGRSRSARRPRPTS